MFVYHGFDDTQMFDNLLVESLLIQELSYQLRTETFRLLLLVFKCNATVLRISFSNQALAAACKKFHTSYTHTLSS